MGIADNEPLTDAECDRLEAFLKSCNGGKAMNVEKLDGFFAALIAGPDTVMPSEYYPEVFGDEMKFGSIDEANEILGLMMRKWNQIASTPLRAISMPPQIFEDENGELRGNEWANDSFGACRCGTAHGLSLWRTRNTAAL